MRGLYGLLPQIFFKCLICAQRRTQTHDEIHIQSLNSGSFILSLYYRSSLSLSSLSVASFVMYLIGVCEDSMTYPCKVIRATPGTVSEQYKSPGPPGAYIPVLSLPFVLHFPLCKLVYLTQLPCKSKAIW